MRTMPDAGQQQQLLDLAEQSIRHRLEHGQGLHPDPAQFDAELQQPGACFVTLHRHGKLRGCIGSLEAYRPLVLDLAANAEAAAFSDPRFPALRPNELTGLDLHISLIGPPEALEVNSEAELLAQLEPGEDGLILQAGYHRATFLPSVWEQLPDPREFLGRLKQKAGLAENFWSDELHFQRYRTLSFGRSLTDSARQGPNNDDTGLNR